MTQLIVLRASAPHPPTHVPTPNTHTHTHTGSNEEPPTQLQTPVCLCWKRGGGYTHSHSRGRNIAIMCAHTHTYTQLWLSYCGRGGLMIADKHTVHTCSDARFAHDFLILSSHSPEHWSLEVCLPLRVPSLFTHLHLYRWGGGSERINERMHKLVNECVSSIRSDACKETTDWFSFEHFQI